MGTRVISVTAWRYTRGQYIRFFLAHTCTDFRRFCPPPPNSNMITSAIGTLHTFISTSGFLVHFWCTISPTRKTRFSLLNRFTRRGKTDFRSIISIFILTLPIAYATFLRLSHDRGYASILTAFTLGSVSQLLVLLQIIHIAEALKLKFETIKNTCDVNKHETLVDLVNLINCLYGPQMLVSLIDILMNFVIESWKAVIVINEFKATLLFNTRDFTSAMCLIVFYFTKLVYLCATCSSTIVQVIHKYKLSFKT